MSLDALGLNGAFHFLTQTFPLFFLSFLHFSLFYFVRYKQFSLPQVTCLICVHKFGRVCNAIVCTESRRVRCMDLTNCYGRVLFKDR